MMAIMPLHLFMDIHDFFSIVAACRPFSVKLLPRCRVSRLLFDAMHQIIAGIDDGGLGKPIRRIGHQMLDMGPHAVLWRRKISTAHSRTGCAQAAEIVLFRYHRTAKGKEPRFKEGLRKGKIPANAFPARFFVVSIHDFFRRRLDGKLRIIERQECNGPGSAALRAHQRCSPCRSFQGSSKSVPAS